MTSISHQNLVEIIAEIGNAHDGDPAKALKLAHLANEAGADAVKFQVYQADELLVRSHPRYQHFKEYSFPPEFWSNAISDLQRTGAQVYCDVFGLDALRIARQAGADGFKVHASDLGNNLLLKELAGTSGRLYLSAGGSTLRELSRALKILDPCRERRITLLHGFQAYPTSPEDAALDRIQLLRKIFGNQCEIGYMDHSSADSLLAWTLPLMALALGASVLEKHITLNRAAKGTDYYSAFNPDEFQKFVLTVREAEKAVASHHESFSAAERKYRDEVRKRWVTLSALSPGHIVAESDLSIKRVHAEGFCPDLNQLLHKPLIRPLEADSVVRASDVQQQVIALIVARMKSARLPGKALIDIAGMPALEHLFSRVRQAQTVSKIVLCTTQNLEDRRIVELAEHCGISTFCGDEEDVLSRMLGALEVYPGDIAVRITGDDILVDPVYLDRTVLYHLYTGTEYTSAKDIPSGTEVEVFNVQMLKDLSFLVKDGNGTEYLTSYVHDHQDQFRCTELPVPPHHQKKYRLTLDTSEDLAVLQALLGFMKDAGKAVSYTIDDIINFMEAHPNVARLNAALSESSTPSSIVTEFEWTRLG